MLSSICLKQFNDDAAFASVGNAFQTLAPRYSKLFLKLSVRGFGIARLVSPFLKSYLVLSQSLVYFSLRYRGAWPFNVLYIIVAVWANLLS